MESLAGFYCSDALTYKPLAKLGWSVDEVPWRQSDRSWSDFDLVVIRSPWDYFNHLTEFVEVLEQIDASEAELANPLEVVRWNMEKTYLRELAERGVVVVPTLWLQELAVNDVSNAFEQFAVQEIVIKPTVGAGASDTFRIRSDNSAGSIEAALRAFRKRPVMVQPFLKSIIERGEFSLFYFGGEFSHAISKRPAAGDFRVQEEHGGIIELCRADRAMLDAAESLLEAIDTELLYARVDFVYLASGEMAVIEIELIEPSLYFGYDEHSPVRYAAALDRMYRRG